MRILIVSAISLFFLSLISSPPYLSCETSISHYVRYVNKIFDKLDFFWYYYHTDRRCKVKERILRIRKESKLTQDVFAERLGLSKNFVWMLEKGERVPSDRTIADICREFNVNKEWLLTGNGDMYDIPEDDVAAAASDLLEESNPFYDIIISIMKSYKKLDDKSQAALNDLIGELLDNMKKRD